MKKFYFLLSLHFVFIAIADAQLSLSRNFTSLGTLLKTPQWNQFMWSSNTSLGFGALESVSTGINNTAVGEFALESTTTGSSNSAFGVYANNNGNGSSNQSFGYQSLDVNTGSYNNAFGAYALLNNSSGTQNVAIGDSTLSVNTTGSENTAVGSHSGPASGNTGLSNTGAFGYGATVSSSNEIVIGNSSITEIFGYVGWTDASDGRFKKNIKENVPGIEFIKLLKPITYTLDITGINSHINATGNAFTSEVEKSAIQEKEAIVYTGFVAQDVEAAAKKLNYDFSGVATPKSETDIYGLRYSQFVVPLVKAMQELSATNDSLKTAQSNLQTQINSLSQEITALKAATSAAMLQQNAPNPFTNRTVINYKLPAGTVDAQLTVTDEDGHLLKDVVLNNSKGPGQATVNAGNLAAGTYYYSLVINGKIIGTRKMVLTR